MIENFTKTTRSGLKLKENEDLPPGFFSKYGPQNIIKLEWVSNGKNISLEYRSMLSFVIPNRKMIALIIEKKEPEIDSELSIYNEDGTKRLTIPNTQKIKNINREGVFLWFEPSHNTSLNCFRVAFSLKRENSIYLLEIDSLDGKIINTSITR